MKYTKAFSGKLAFLSNFYPSPISFLGITYPTVEHAFQALKTLDNNERLRISKLTSANDAKKAGRMLQIRPDWNEVRIECMSVLLRLKFLDPTLRQKLLDTGDMHLEETNWWGDKFWGVCEGVGENHLGKLLMKIREEIRNEGTQS